MWVILKIWILIFGSRLDSCNHCYEVLFVPHYIELSCLIYLQALSIKISKSFHVKIYLFGVVLCLSELLSREGSFGWVSTSPSRPAVFSFVGTSNTNQKFQKSSDREFSGKSFRFVGTSNPPLELLISPPIYIPNGLHVKPWLPPLSTVAPHSPLSNPWGELKFGPWDFFVKVCIGFPTPRRLQSPSSLLRFAREKLMVFVQNSLSPDLLM